MGLSKPSSRISNRRAEFPSCASQALKVRLKDESHVSSVRSRGRHSNTQAHDLDNIPIDTPSVLPIEPDGLVDEDGTSKECPSPEVVGGLFDLCRQGDAPHGTVIDLTSATPALAIDVVSSPVIEITSNMALIAPRVESNNAEICATLDSLPSTPEVLNIPVSATASALTTASLLCSASTSATLSSVSRTAHKPGQGDLISTTELFATSHSKLWPFLDGERVSPWKTEIMDLPGGADEKSELVPAPSTVLYSSGTAGKDVALPFSTGPRVRPYQRFEICQTGGKVTVMDPPTQALSYSLGVPLDFAPWNGRRVEDVMTDGTIKGGLIAFSGVANEGHSGKAVGRETMTSRLGGMLLSHVLTRTLKYRRDEAVVQVPSSFRPPPRVTTNDKKRELWFAELARTAVPIRRFSRTIPHGVRGKALLDNCLANFVPIDRAAWLAKCVGINEIRSIRRKTMMSSSSTTAIFPPALLNSKAGHPSGSNSGLSALLTDAKWMLEWTLEVERFLYVSVIQTCHTNKDWKMVAQYGADLISQLLCLQLLDTDHFLTWISSDEIKLTPDIYPVWLLFVKVCWRSFVSNRHCASKLALRLLSELSKLEAVNGSTFATPTSVNIRTLIRQLATHQPAAFVLPFHWARVGPQLKCILRDESDRESPASTIFSALENRSRALHDTFPLPSRMFLARQELFSYLDSFAKSDLNTELWDQIFDLSHLASRCRSVDLPPHHRCLSVIRWACAKSQAGEWPLYLASRILREWQKVDIVTRDQLRFSPPEGWSAVDRSLFTILMMPRECGLDTICLFTLSRLLGLLVQFRIVPVRTCNQYLIAMGVKSRAATKQAAARLQATDLNQMLQTQSRQQCLQSYLGFDTSNELPQATQLAGMPLDSIETTTEGLLLQLYFQLPTEGMSYITRSQWHSNLAGLMYSHSAHDVRFMRLKCEISLFLDGNALPQGGIRRLYILKEELRALCVPDRYRISGWILSRYQLELLSPFYDWMDKGRGSTKSNSSTIPQFLQLSPRAFSTLRFVLETIQDILTIAKLMVGASSCSQDFCIDTPIEPQVSLLQAFLSTVKANYLSLLAIGCIPHLTAQLLRMFHRIQKRIEMDVDQSVSILPNDCLHLLSICKALSLDPATRGFQFLHPNQRLEVCQAVLALHGLVSQQQSDSRLLDQNSLISPVTEDHSDPSLRAHSSHGSPFPPSPGLKSFSFAQAKQSFDQLTTVGAQIFSFFTQPSLTPVDPASTPTTQRTLQCQQRTVDAALADLKGCDNQILLSIFSNWIGIYLRREASGDLSHVVRYYPYLEFLLTMLIGSNAVNSQWVVDLLFPFTGCESTMPALDSGTSLPTPESFRKEESSIVLSKTQMYRFSQLLISVLTPADLPGKDRLQTYLLAFFPLSLESGWPDRIIDKVLSVIRRILDLNLECQSEKDGHFSQLVEAALQLVRRPAFLDVLFRARVKFGEAVLINDHLGLTLCGIAENQVARQLLLYLVDPTGEITASTVTANDNVFASRVGLRAIVSKIVDLSDDVNTVGCQLLLSFFLAGVGAESPQLSTLPENGKIKLGDTESAAEARIGLFESLQLCISRWSHTISCKFYGSLSSKVDEYLCPRASRLAGDVNAFLDHSDIWSPDDGAHSTLGWTTFVNIDASVSQRLCENSATQILMLFSSFETYLKDLGSSEGCAAGHEPSRPPPVPYAELYGHSLLLNYTTGSLPAEANIQFIAAAISKIQSLATWFPKITSGPDRRLSVQPVFNKIIGDAPKEMIGRFAKLVSPETRVPSFERAARDIGKVQEFEYPEPEMPTVPDECLYSVLYWLQVFLHAVSAHSCAFSSCIPSLCPDLDILTGLATISDLLFHPILCQPRFQWMSQRIYDIILILSDKLSPEDRASLGGTVYKRGFGDQLSFLLPLHGPERLLGQHVALPSRSGGKSASPRKGLKRSPPSEVGLNFGLRDEPSKRSCAPSIPLTRPSMSISLRLPGTTSTASPSTLRVSTTTTTADTSPVSPSKGSPTDTDTPGLVSASEPRRPASVPIFRNVWEMLPDTGPGKSVASNDTSVSLTLFGAKRVRLEPPRTLCSDDDGSEADGSGDECVEDEGRDPVYCSLTNAPWKRQTRPGGGPVLPTGFNICQGVSKKVREQEQAKEREVKERRLQEQGRERVKEKGGDRNDRSDLIRERDGEKDPERERDKDRSAGKHASVRSLAQKGPGLGSGSASSLASSSKLRSRSQQQLAVPQAHLSSSHINVNANNRSLPLSTKPAGGGNVRSSSGPGPSSLAGGAFGSSSGTAPRTRTSQNQVQGFGSSRPGRSSRYQ